MRFQVLRKRFRTEDEYSSCPGVDIFYLGFTTVCRVYFRKCRSLKVTGKHLSEICVWWRRTVVMSCIESKPGPGADASAIDAPCPDILLNGEDAGELWQPGWHCY